MHHITHQRVACHWSAVRWQSVYLQALESPDGSDREGFGHFQKTRSVLNKACLHMCHDVGMNTACITGAIHCRYRSNCTKTCFTIGRAHDSSIATRRTPCEILLALRRTTSLEGLKRLGLPGRNGCEHLSSLAASACLNFRAIVERIAPPAAASPAHQVPVDLGPLTTEQVACRMSHGVLRVIVVGRW